jgi:hypothetical protein
LVGLPRGRTTNCWLLAKGVGDRDGQALIATLTFGLYYDPRDEQPDHFLFRREISTGLNVGNLLAKRVQHRRHVRELRLLSGGECLLCVEGRQHARQDSGLSGEGFQLPLHLNRTDQTAPVERQNPLALLRLLGQLSAQMSLLFHCASGLV